MSNLIEAIQKECHRVQDVLLPQYQAIGPAGMFGAAMLKASVERGEQAIASGDAVEMIRALKDLQGCE